MNKNFDVLFENLLERYQQGGLLIGDRVKFRKDALKLDFFKNKAANFIEMVKTVSEPSFDLTLRVSAIKSIYPTTTQNYRGGTESPDHIFVDVIIEYAPGLYRNPMTVPIESLELQDDGINRGPVPDSVKRKSKIHGPEPVKTKENNNLKAEVNLTNKNAPIPGGKKWGDSPGGGSDWKPLPKNKRNK
jgi:hypothetical protein